MLENDSDYSTPSTETDPDHCPCAAAGLPAERAGELFDAHQVYAVLAAPPTRGFARAVLVELIELDRTRREAAKSP